MDYFKIDESPVYQITEGGKTILIDPAPVLQHPYNIRNYGVYDLQKKEIVSPGAIDKYTYEFSARVRSAEFYGENGFIKLKDFLNYHYENSKDKPLFLEYLQYGILENMVLMDGHRCLILIREWLRVKKEDLNPTAHAHTQKIKWLGTPEQFGFLFGELASKGYIELPTKAGEGVFSKLAELSLMFFEIQPSKGKNVGNQTTTENLERALNPGTNQLSLKGKANLKLPALEELK